MKKQTKILLVLIFVSIAVFATLSVFYLYDGYYYSLAQCEQNYKKSLTDGEMIVKCEADGLVYEVWSAENNEIYIIQIIERTLLGITKYKVSFNKGYSVEKALNYYEQTKNIKWTNAPEININTDNDVFSWCIADRDAELFSDTYELITYNDREILLFYKLQTFNE